MLTVLSHLLLWSRLAAHSMPESKCIHSLICCIQATSYPCVRTSVVTHMTSYLYWTTGPLCYTRYITNSRQEAWRERMTGHCKFCETPICVDVVKVRQTVIAVLQCKVKAATREADKWWRQDRKYLCPDNSADQVRQAAHCWSLITLSCCCSRSNEMLADMWQLIVQYSTWLCAR